MTIRIAAADHPSMHGEIDAFVDRLRDEHRFFGPTAKRNPKPTRSLLVALQGRGGFRVAATDGVRIVGLARVDGAGELFLAVDAEHRGLGIGTDLGRAAAERARDLNYARLVIRSTQRSRAVRRVGDDLGCLIVDEHRGRIELILDLAVAERSA